MIFAYSKNRIIPCKFNLYISSHQPILWSSIFRQNNSLLRHSAAFKAILSNPDPDHRKVLKEYTFLVLNIA